MHFQFIVLIHQSVRLTPIVSLCKTTVEAAAAAAAELTHMIMLLMPFVKWQRAGLNVRSV